MDMRLPVKIHPTLQPVAEQVAEQEGMGLLELVVAAVEQYLADTALVSSKPDDEWSRWADEAEQAAEALDGVSSLDRDLSARVVDRARRDGVRYLRVIDRAVRRYVDRRIDMVR